MTGSDATIRPESGRDAPVALPALQAERTAEIVSYVRRAVPRAIDSWLPHGGSLDPGGRCLPATRMGLDTLRYFGVKAEPLPTRALAVNSDWQEWMHGEAKGKPPMPDPAWSVAVGWPSPGRGLDLHLVLLVEDALLLDLDARQFNRPVKGIHVPETLLIETDPLAHPDTGEPVTHAGADLPEGGRIDYVRHPEPTRWSTALDWRKADKPAGWVIRWVKEALGGEGVPHARPLPQPPNGPHPPRRPADGTILIGNDVSRGGDDD